jgi:hypothetical protein
MAKYTDIRSTIQSGDLFFYSHHNKIGDRIIKWKTKSPFSHVSMALCIADRVFTLESNLKHGVSINPTSLDVPDVLIRMRLKWDTTTESFALSAVGQKYSLIDAIRAGIGLRTNNKGFICSEYVAEILKVNGEFVNEWGLTPKSLYDRYNVIRPVVSIDRELS